MVSFAKILLLGHVLLGSKDGVAGFSLNLRRQGTSHLCGALIRNSSSFCQPNKSSPTALKSSIMNGLPLFESPSNSFYLSRIVFLRALAFVYGVAFLVARDQNKGLIGDRGITPARHILNEAEKRGQEKRKRRAQWLKEPYAGAPRKSSYKLHDIFWNLKVVRSIGMALNRNNSFQGLRERLWDRTDHLGRPVTSLLWLARNRQKLNPWLDGVALVGLSLSMLVFAIGAANVPILLTLWVCQRSVMAVGGPWYGFGWEPQLAELGFHAMFLVPLFDLRQIPAVVPSSIVLIMIRWHLFRVMMGAGLIKFRSRDPKWRLKHLSAMDFFYETQPIPNPLTRYMHWAPKIWHRIEVLSNHLVEVIAPWLLLVPSIFCRRLGAYIQLVFQSVLIVTGNLSFLNWLTCVPAVACIDDQVLAGLFPYRHRNMAALAALKLRPSLFRRFMSSIFFTLVACLSFPVVKNLLSKSQVMNTSFDPLRLISTYGAFGTVNEERMELIISAASNLDGPWKEYTFRAKPSDPNVGPRFLSPYHYRLDWQLWIASAAGTIDRSPWIFNFLLKLLQQEPDVMSLLADDPFAKDSKGPMFIRVDKYKYRFHKPVSGKSTMNEAYWDREKVGRFFPRQGVATVASLQDMVNKNEDS